MPPIKESQSEFQNLKKHVQTNIFHFIENEYFQNFSNLERNYLLDKCSELTKQIMLNLENWFQDEIPDKYKKIVILAINKEKWYDIIEAFKHELAFGTNGIRGKLSVLLDEKKCIEELNSLNDLGFDSNILRGSNSINEITIMKNISGLINYLQKKKFSKIIVGYDSRVGSKLFSRLITNMLLEKNFNVILFNDPNSLPELSFAVTHFNADMGVEITASHNDKRYNGYKLITKSGSPPNEDLRKEITHEIFSNKKKISYDLLSINYNNKNFDFISNNVLIIESSNITNSNQNSKIDLKEHYLNQILNTILNKSLIKKFSSEIKIGYSALHGTGYDSVSKLLTKINIKNVNYISKMISPDPLFSLFDSKQILDPSDSKTASIVVNAFISQYGLDEFNKLDALSYTDPDADRLGVVVKVSNHEQSIYGKWRLLKANDVWSIFLWYILDNFSSNPKLQIFDFDELFVVKSFVTSDLIRYISKKYHVECIDGKVGFSDLTDIVQNKWNENKINIGMFEESCGYGISGNPVNESKMHILEKDGIMALAFLIEIISYGKSKNLSISDLLNNIYLDDDIGFFSTYRKELPEEGIFEGIEGDLHLEQILKNVENFCSMVNKKIKDGNPLKICDIQITKIEKFSTGRYDTKFWKGFPDEGIRFYLDSQTNHITIRASGTEPKIRIFVQYRMLNFKENDILKIKSNLESLVKKLSENIEKFILI